MIADTTHVEKFLDASSTRPGHFAIHAAFIWDLAQDILQADLFPYCMAVLSYLAAARKVAADPKKRAICATCDTEFTWADRHHRPHQFAVLQPQDLPAAEKAKHTLISGFCSGCVACGPDFIMEETRRRWRADWDPGVPGSVAPH